MEQNRNGRRSFIFHPLPRTRERAGGEQSLATVRSWVHSQGQKGISLWWDFLGACSGTKRNSLAESLVLILNFFHDRLISRSVNLASFENTSSAFYLTMCLKNVSLLGQFVRYKRYCLYFCNFSFLEGLVDRFLLWEQVAPYIVPGVVVLRRMLHLRLWKSNQKLLIFMCYGWASRLSFFFPLVRMVVLTATEK